MYKPPTKQLSLSVYVDDLKMAGPKANLSPMWKEIGKHINLDPPTSFDKSVYLGCCQYDCPPTADKVQSQMTFFNQTFGDEEFEFKTADQTNLTDDRAEILAARSAKRKNKPKKQQKVLDKAAAAELSDRGGSQIPLTDKQLQSCFAHALSATNDDIDHSVQGYYYKMRGHAEKSVEKYLELTGMYECRQN